MAKAPMQDPLRVLFENERRWSGIRIERTTGTEGAEWQGLKESPLSLKSKVAPAPLRACPAYAAYHTCAGFGGYFAAKPVSHAAYGRGCLETLGASTPWNKEMPTSWHELQQKLTLFTPRGNHSLSHAQGLFGLWKLRPRSQCLVLSEVAKNAITPTLKISLFKPQAWCNLVFIMLLCCIHFLWPG